MIRPVRPRRPLLRAVEWFALSVAGLVAAVRLGRDRPGSPPLSAPEEWQRWFADRAPLDAAAGGLRLVAIGLLGYLVLITVLQLVAIRRSDGFLRRLLSTIAPRFLLPALASAVVSTGVIAGPIAAAAGGTNTPPAPGPSTSTSAPPVMEVVDSTLVDEDDLRTSLPWAANLDEAPPAAPPTTASPLAQPPTAASPDVSSSTSTHVVQRGEHFWSIAERVLSDRGVLAPSDKEIADYWTRLIDANRGRLVDPDNPDLILPGQEFRIP